MRRTDPNHRHRFGGLGPLLVASIACALLLATVTGAQRGGTTIGVDEIQPGMQGYGLSVLRGTQPERFDVEVIDVLHNFRPDQDLILARTPHPLLNRAIAVGGMSGSPIYLDGRLAGAYAYGWGFGLDPVIGITPISSMLHEMGRTVRPDAFPGARPLGKLRPTKARRRARSAQNAAALAPHTPGTRSDAFARLRSHRDVYARATTGPAGMQAAMTPLMLGGFTDDVAAALGEELEPFGLVPLQGGGGAASPGAARPQFVDGGAIGVQLVRGDISATAIGTVTHVGNGGRLVAFGHPMMNLGQIGLPTSTARVLHVFLSQARSFKIAEAIAPYGTLINDRPSAIVIDTNLQAATIPVRIRLNGIEGAARTEWNVEVASHPSLSPVLVFSALSNAIKASASDQTDVAFTARYTTVIEGQPPVTLEDRGAMFGGPADNRALAQLRLFELFDIAYSNPFEESRIERVEIELDVRFERDIARIVEARVADDEVDPGSDVDVTIVYERYGRGLTERTVQVHVPTSAAGQTVELKVQGGGSVSIEQPTPRNTADLIRSVSSAYPTTSIVTSLELPSRGLRFRGHVVTSLPRSALNSLERVTRESEGRPFATYLRRPIDVGHVVVGSAEIDLRVRETPRGR